MKMHRLEESVSDEEREIREILSRMEKDFRLQIKPYIDRLVAIDMMKPRRYVWITEDGDVPS